jgi:squalene-associated FAD-dependent desaturase
MGEHPARSLAVAGKEPGDVVIVGAGLAGLAAASVLAPRGLRITLLEARPRLGGRAGSFFEPSTGEWIDNCQHVGMGCCTNLADFCRRVGIARFIRTDRVLYFLDEFGRISRISAARLPAPFHYVPSLLRSCFLTLAEKIRVARGIWALMRTASAAGEMSFRDWLMAHGQTRRTCERFWAVILTSALNETLDRIDYRYARKVMIEAFLSHPQSGTVEVPTVPLAAFYGAALERWLTRHQVTIRCNAAVGGLKLSGTRVAACTTRHGDEIVADHYLLAVPVHRVLELLPDDLVQGHETFTRLRQFESSPITSVHLWFDQPVMRLPHLVCVGRTVQWLFRRTPGTAANERRSAQTAASTVESPTSDSSAALDFTRSTGRSGDYVQAVISASGRLATLGHARILELVLGDVRESLPKSRSAKLLHYRVVTERFATYSIVPGIDRLRPDQRTPIENLWLAGDYTQTGWPATMEGAVRSGYLAARAILRSNGIECDPVRPTRPTGTLVRRFIARS